MEPQYEFGGHQLPGGRVQLSPHHKWLASYGTDGSVMLRTIGQMVGIFSASMTSSKPFNCQWFPN